MKLYDQTDFDVNKAEKRAALMCTLLFALPGLALAVAGFALRIEVLCTLGCFVAGACTIFLYDLRIKPAFRYGAFLAEAHSGLTRQTLGALVRICCDPVYQDGVNFYEVILNIYEDMDEEGERRFLLDARKQIEQKWLGEDVVFTHHGSYVLEAHLASDVKKDAQA